jgi:hypothetical protein
MISKLKWAALECCKSGSPFGFCSLLISVHMTSLRMNYEKYYYKDKDYWDRVWTGNIIMPEASSLIVQITAVITARTNGHTHKRNMSWLDSLNSKRKQPYCSSQPLENFTHSDQCCSYDQRAEILHKSSRRS